MYESSRAYLVEADLAAAHTIGNLLAMASSGADGIEPLGGFDTFWYTWVSVNRDTRLLR